VILLPHILPLFAAWLATALALWIEHVILKRPPWRIEPPATYRVGVLTIIGGYTLWIGLALAAGIRSIDIWVALVALIVIGPGAGAVVEGLYWWDARNERSEALQRGAGELAGVGKGLVRELKRGAHDTNSHN
jgi:hypothetical protein